MCGRYAEYLDLKRLLDYLSIDRVNTEVTPNYNVAPTQKVLAVVRSNAENVLGRLHWGLVPSWSKDTKVGFKMINARSETVATKPSFRSAFKKRRCLIPASGYYEWEGPKGAKTPMFITRPDQAPMAFAGLWEAWDNKGQLETPYYSCTILTTDASDAIVHIHDRMPVTLKSEAYGQWLDTDSEIDPEAFFSDAVQREFAFWPVSKAVNSVKNNYPALIDKAV